MRDCMRNVLITIYFAYQHILVCIIDCGDPPIPTNGTVTLTIPGNTTVGSSATQACNPGFYRYGGRAKIYCGDDGSWSSGTIICSLRGMYILVRNILIAIIYSHEDQSKHGYIHIIYSHELRG